MLLLLQAFFELMTPVPNGRASEVGDIRDRREDDVILLPHSDSIITYELAAIDHSQWLDMCSISHPLADSVTGSLRAIGGYI